MTRPCAKPGCESAGVPHPRLLCKQCWFALPQSARNTVKGYILSRDFDSARIYLADFYAAEREGRNWQR